MSSPTCISCQVVFSSYEGQREHYKSDWHRYNLKRKVAELPPVNAENFRERVLAQRAQAEQTVQGSSRNCTFCKKHFASINAFTNHLSSKKHVDAVKNYDSKVSHRVQQENLKNLLKTVATRTQTPPSASTTTTTRPDLALPHTKNQDATAESDDDDDDYVDTDEDDDDDDSWGDLEEGEPLKVEECLFCPTVSVSLEDNLKHMALDHSLLIPDAEYCVDLEGLVEYLGEKVGVHNVCLWCDDRGKRFQSTKAVQQHMMDKGHCRILHEGEALVQYADFYDYSSSYPDGEENPDQEVDDNVIDAQGYELVLPSGATVGHRSLMRYYRQRLPPLREASKNKHLLTGVLHQYRALGWTGTTGAAAVRNAKDLGYMRKLRAKHSMQVGVKANKLQRHFRQQNPL